MIVFVCIMCVALFVGVCFSFALHLLLLGSCYAVHINALSINVHQKEQYEVELIRILKKINIIHVYVCEVRNSTQLMCLRLERRYNIQRKPVR